LEFCYKQPFKTCKFNEHKISICQLNSERNYSVKKRQKNEHLMDDALKTRGVIYFNVETWWLFANPLSKFMDTRLNWSVMN